MAPIRLSDHHHDVFERDGFVIIRNVLSTDEVAGALSQFEPLFSGTFETGRQPDEWNWRSGQSDPTLTRQICNGWRADNIISGIVLRSDIGQACAQLRGWSGARLNQDNIIWKPPGTKALGFHQDESYQNWNEPGEMMTCWMTLDDTSNDGGTIEYVRGSHRWELAGPIEQFHAPDDPVADLNAAARQADETPEFVPIEVQAGDAVIHHGKTWHGSRSNVSKTQRRTVVAHCMAGHSRYHREHDHEVYGRYRQEGSLEMPTEHFPWIWRDGGT